MSDNEELKEKARKYLEVFLPEMAGCDCHSCTSAFLVRDLLAALETAEQGDWAEALITAQEHNAALQAENARLGWELEKAHSELSRYRAGVEVRGRAYTGFAGTNSIVALHEALQPYLGHDATVLVMAGPQEVQG